MGNSEESSSEHRTFSMVVPQSIYLKLRLLAAHKDISLGALCRNYLLEAVTRDSKLIQVRKRAS